MPAKYMGILGHAELQTTIGTLRCPIILVDDITANDFKMDVDSGTLEGSVWAVWWGSSNSDKKFYSCDDFFIIGKTSQHKVYTIDKTSSTPVAIIENVMSESLPIRNDYITQTMLAFVTQDETSYKLCTCYSAQFWGATYGVEFSTSVPSNTMLGYSIWTWLSYGGTWQMTGNSYAQDIIGAAKIVKTPVDPYDPGGGTEPGGGGGDFDNTSTPIDIPNLPSISASDTGFITLFNPTMRQLVELSSYMWSDLFDVEGWKKIFANPMDAILGLSIVPVSVPGNGSRPVKVGNISTGVSLTVASSQYVEVDCGSINVKEYWGAYLDYDPYTKAEIYLPYIGTHAIAVDDIMNKTVHVVYHVDILSGACCAYIKCGESVLYSFVGQCSCSIPITGSDWTNVINGALSIAGAIGSMVATGGASAPMAIGTMASAAVNSLKPTVEKSGSLAGMGGILGIQVPYLILTRPRQALPSNQNHYTGYPSFITAKLGDCQGYTEIESVHLEGIPATQAEISEIETLLKGGVIF